MEISGVGRSSGVSEQKPQDNGVAQLEAQVANLQNTLKQFKADLTEANGDAKDKIEKNIAETEKQIANLQQQIQRSQTSQGGQTPQSVQQENRADTGAENQSAKQVAGAMAISETAEAEAVVTKQVVALGKTEGRPKVDEYISSGQAGEVIDNTYRVEKEGDHWKITFNRPVEAATTDLGPVVAEDQEQGRGLAGRKELSRG